MCSRFLVAVGDVDEVIRTLVQYGKGTLLVTLEAGKVESGVLVLVNVPKVKVHWWDARSEQICVCVRVCV